MAKIAAKRSEFKCMPRLCNILDSQNGCSCPEIISNKLIMGEEISVSSLNFLCFFSLSLIMTQNNALLCVTDYSRKLNHHASFDEECRKIPVSIPIH